MENQNQQPPSEQSSQQPVSQPVVLPSAPQKSKLPLFIIAFVVLILVGGGGYLIQSSKFKVQSSNPPASQRGEQLKSQNSTPTNVVIISPTSILSDPTANPDQIGASWKTFTDPKNLYSFKYPANWEVLAEVPQDYKAMLFDPNQSGWKLEDWLNSKMFAGTCRGPILRNTQVKTTLIAFEIIDKDSDGAFCWSSGSFITPAYKRTIKTLTPFQEVEVSKWSLGDYVYPVTQNNSGKKYSPEWKGELFQQVSVSQNSKYNAVVAIVYKDRTDNTAEQVYDQILSTFKFTQ